MVPKQHCNPVKDLDWREGAFDTFQKYKVLMFQQQKQIYTNIKDQILKMDAIEASVIEFGCGIGIGTAYLARYLAPARVTGTDNIAENIALARELHMGVPFYVHNIEASKVVHSIVGAVGIAVEVIEHVGDPVKGIRNMLASVSKELWLSTPNGNGKTRPPSNPYHVCEYTPLEMFDIIKEASKECSMVVTRVLDYKHFQPITDSNTKVDPLVYHIVKEG
jgi:2-polyprenyl-3-methyl-5-hydroxy-6-metoxy-1,4-benzoquinol methylase